MPKAHSTPPTSLTPEERRHIFGQCERWLSGHPRQPVRGQLAALTESVDTDELPDAYGEGALIEDFEREVAALLGKEAAVFMPSGTMAQQIALRIWSDHTGSRSVAFHPTCHLEIHEQKGYERLHGLHGIVLGSRDRLITMDDLKAPEPLAAVLWELPQREIGGQLPAWEDLQEQVQWAKSRGAAAHMDGARLWESAAFYGREYAEIADLFDSVYVSFYKGIGAIAGAALAGSAEFIAEARVWQRRHGGNLVQLFPYVLSARAGLRKRLSRFAGYHTRAMEIAEALSNVDGLLLKPNPPHTNMAHLYLRGASDALLAASVELAREERVALTGWFGPTDIPGYVYTEMTIGDGAEAFTTEEIVGYFTRILERAKQ